MDIYKDDFRYKKYREEALLDLLEQFEEWLQQKNCNIDLDGFKMLDKIESFGVDCNESKNQLELAIILSAHEGNNADELLEDIDQLINLCEEIEINSTNKKQQYSVCGLYECLNNLLENLQSQEEQGSNEYSKYLNYDTYKEYLTNVIEVFKKCLHKNNYRLKDYSKNKALSFEEASKIMLDDIKKQGIYGKIGLSVKIK